MAVLYSGENASVLYLGENASGPSKRGNSGGLASAPWPARHNDPSQGRSSDLQLNRREEEVPSHSCIYTRPQLIRPNTGSASSVA